MIRLVVAMEEDSEDKDVEEALAVEKDFVMEKVLVMVADQLLATTMEL